jgi:hypothetical protein
MKAFDGLQPCNKEVLDVTIVSTDALLDAALMYNGEFSNENSWQENKGVPARADGNGGGPVSGGSTNRQQREAGTDEEEEATRPRRRRSGPGRPG